MASNNYERACHLLQVLDDLEAQGLSQTSWAVPIREMLQDITLTDAEEEKLDGLSASLRQQRERKPVADKYGWSRHHEECAHGPFDSPELAFADAAEVLREESDEDRVVEIELGRCDFIQPASYVNADIDSVIDSMEDRVHDDVGFFYDDAVFSVKTSIPEAEKALEEALEKWAEEHVQAEEVWMLMSTRTVRLHTRTGVVDGYQSNVPNEPGT